MLIDVDPQTAKHLARALDGHLRWLRENGIDAPREIAVLHGHAVAVARSGQARPLIAQSEAAEHDRTMTDNMLLTLSYEDTAKRLSVSPRTVRRMVANGELKVIDVAGSPRVRVADLNEYVETKQPRAQTKGA